MARRTKDEAEKTRTAILDAAEKVFYARGVTRSSLEQIAEEAKVTRGAVYWHFKDKPALCDAMAKRIFLPYEDMLAKLAAKPSNEPLEDLKKASLHALKMMARDKRRRNVVTILFLRCEYVEEMLSLINRRNECENRMLALSEKLFSHAKQLGKLAPGWTPHLAAITTYSLLSGLILNALERRRGFGFLSVGVPCIESFFASLEAN
jgi:AcrR family transcriptional regulator